MRDYYGTLVDQGRCGARLTVKPLGPGWYKLYVFGTEDQGAPWGKIVGGTNIAVFRRDPHFRRLRPKTRRGAGTGSGTSRRAMSSAWGRSGCRCRTRASRMRRSKCWQARSRLTSGCTCPMTLFVKRVLMVAFPNGTKDLAGVRKIVAHFQNDVEYWEPRNEPNGGSSGTDFAVKEMKPFYDTVKSVNPKLKVMGPGTVGIAPPGHMLGWIEDFLKAGGGKSIDAFSFHAYNTVNGDVEMARWRIGRARSLADQDTAWAISRSGRPSRATSPPSTAPISPVCRAGGRWIR